MNPAARLGAPPAETRRAPTSRPGVEIWTAVGLTAVLVFFLVSGAVAYLNIQTLRDDNQQILHSHKVITSLDELLSTVQDAETGQRGYLLTGDDRYLEPYESATGAVSSRLDAVASLIQDNPTQQANLAQVRRHIDAKLQELKATIDLRRSKGAAVALALVSTDRGKLEMDAVRTQLEVMRQ
jgi:CHASE3 domain sensor protein